MTSTQKTTTNKTTAADLGMVGLSLATLLLAFAVPLFAPALALGGIVGSIRLPRSGARAARWLALTIFTIALVTALAVDLGLLAASTGAIHTSPAVAPVN